MMGDNQNIAVSIHCLTYNHALFIRQCLDGFVMQKTTFRFEAIVHDDASTDGTADIIREYEAKYPEIIKPIYEKENQYSKGDGSLGRILDEHTKGKYVAVCEGDDYWTDPLKLQKQYDYMESSPDCSLCFHPNYVLYPDNSMLRHEPVEIKEKYTIEDVICKNRGTAKGMSFMMTTNSMFYRWEFIKEEGYPAFWKECPVGDIPTRLFFATKGYFGYIDDLMSVYRKSVSGAWTVRERPLNEIIGHKKRIIKMWKQFDDYTSYQYHGAVISKISELNKLVIVDIMKAPIKCLFHLFRHIS